MVAPRANGNLTGNVLQGTNGEKKDDYETVHFAKIEVFYEPTI